MQTAAVSTYAYGGEFRVPADGIYAGSPQCKPPRGAEYTSGRSCDVIIRHRGGRWPYEKLN